MINYETDGRPYLRYKDENGIETEIQLLEVKLARREDFSVVRETLERIGIAIEERKVLYPSCHILAEDERYFIAHFKELFGLSGRKIDLNEVDIARRNYVAGLLQEWNLAQIVDPDLSQACKDATNSKDGVSAFILPFKLKSGWTIRPKFDMNVYISQKKAARRAA